jgi:exonuclease VII large subunit
VRAIKTTSQTFAIGRGSKARTADCKKNTRNKDKISESEEELASMTSVAENRRRQVEYWTARYGDEKKEAEDKKKAEEEEGDEVEFHDALKPAPTSHTSSTRNSQQQCTTSPPHKPNSTTSAPSAYNQDPNNAAQQTLAKLTEQNEALRKKLRNVARTASLLKQYTALATDENQTDKQRGSQRDVKRLAKELAECRLALEAARRKCGRCGGGAAGPSAEIVAASRTQLAERTR